MSFLVLFCNGIRWNKWLSLDPLLNWQAKEDYERKQREKELRKESGETTWMLPALSKRLSEETESREKVN